MNGILQQKYPKQNADDFLNGIKPIDFFNCIEMNEPAQILPFLIGFDSHSNSDEMDTFLKEISHLQRPDFEVTEILSEKDKKLINKCFQMNIYDMENEAFELDIDFGSQDFQKRFYMKFVTLKEPNESSEYSKINDLKVRVTLKDSRYVFLSRAQLDSLLHKFKRIHGSFLKLKKFLTPETTQFFFMIFDFEQFLMIISSLHQELVLIDIDKGFQLEWKTYTSENITVFDGDNKPMKYFSSRNVDDKKTIREYFRVESFSLIKKQLENQIVEDDELVCVQLRCHGDFFEFLMKGERLRDIPA